MLEALHLNQTASLLTCRLVFLLVVHRSLRFAIDMQHVSNSIRLLLDAPPCCSPRLCNVLFFTVYQVFKAGEQEEDDKDDDDDAFEAPSRGRGGAGGRTIRSKSIGIQFKESLAELMSTISITHPRYNNHRQFEALLSSSLSVAVIRGSLPPRARSTSAHLVPLSCDVVHKACIRKGVPIGVAYGSFERMGVRCGPT